MARTGTAPAQLQSLNPVIHERTRLTIVTYLASVREAAFTDLQNELGLTCGNLTLHMKVLEKNGYVEAEKSFVERRPRTTFRFTKKGEKAFDEYVSLLEGILGLTKSAKAKKRKTSKKR